MVAALAALSTIAVTPVHASLDSSVADTAAQLAEQLRPRRWAVAVPDLGTLDGRMTVLGRYVAEELITALYSRGVSVVERSLLDRTMSELRLGTTDLMDSAQVKRFGYLVGAQAILAGTLTDLGQEVKLNVRVVDVETGQVVGAAASLIAKDRLVSEMLEKTASSRWPTPGPRPRSAGFSRSSRVVWEADLSSYRDGEEIPEWGPGVMVRKWADGSSFLTVSGRERRTFGIYIDFPPGDFVFELDVAYRASRMPVQCSLVLVDESGEQLEVGLSLGSDFTVQLSGDDARRAQSWQPIRFKLGRHGTMYKVIVNDQLVTFGTYDYGRFTGFWINAEPDTFWGNFTLVAPF